MNRFWLRAAVILGVGGVLIGLLIWLLLGQQIGPVREGVVTLGRDLDRVQNLVITLSDELRARDERLLILILQLHADRLNPKNEPLQIVVARYRDELFGSLSFTATLSPPFPAEFRPRVEPSRVVENALRFTFEPTGRTGLVPVLAMRDGKLVKCEKQQEKDGEFYTAAILHEFGYHTYYARLHGCTVEVGRNVRRGQEFANARASKVCLRVWITKPGSVAPSDPRPFLPPL